MDITLQYEGRPPETSDRPAHAPASALNLSLKITPASRIWPDVEAFSLADLPPAIAGRIEVHPLSGCWIVGGYLDPDGYARIGGRGAHRVIWELLKGPVHAGLVLDHREDWGCLSKACGWPAHLLPVTPFVNSTRPGARGVGAVNIRKDRCSVCGTPYDLLNCYFRPNGHRDCRKCTARRQREYQKRLRQRAPDAPVPLLELRRAA